MTRFIKISLILLLLLLLLSGGAAAYYIAHDKPSDVALAAAKKAIKRNGIDPSSVRALAVVDFDKASVFHRMAIYADKNVTQYLVSHGQNSGGLFAREFSNIEGSYQSSLGLYRIGEHYEGKHGKSCRLHGLEIGLNDKAFERHIVLHPAWYVDSKIIFQNLFEGEGLRLGRSQGCPAVSQSVSKEVLSLLTEGTYLYIYSTTPSK